MLLLLLLLLLVLSLKQIFYFLINIISSGMSGLDLMVSY